MSYRCLVLLATLLLASLQFRSNMQLITKSGAKAESVWQSGTEGQKLVRGVPVAGELATGQKHSFSIAAESNQFIKLMISPIDVNVLLTVYGPDGSKIVESLRRYFGPTPISLLTNQTGVHRVEIELRVSPDAPVHYEIRLDQQRGPGAQDQARITAEAVVREAESTKARVEAMQKWEKALQLWRELGDRREEAYTLTRICNIHNYLDQHPLTLQRSQEALKIWQSLNDTSGQAEAFFLLGLTKFDVGQIEAALNNYQVSIKLWRSSDSAAGLARCSIALGVLYLQGGDHQAAISLGNEALDIYRRLMNKTGETSALSLLGHVYRKVGYYQNAADIARRALQLAEESKNPLQQKLAHGLLGESLLNQNELKLALAEFKEEFALHANGEDFRAKAYSLGRFGQVYEELGDQAKALDYYRQALAMHREAGNPQGEAGTLNRLGWLMEKSGQRMAAIEHYGQALPMSRSAGDRAVQVSALCNLARVRRDLGQLKEAGENVEEAIHLIESTRQRTGGRGQRSSYVATVQEAYGLRVDLLMRQRDQQLLAGAKETADGLNLAALQASDQARARTLLESLAEARGGIRSNVPPNLLKREEELQRRLNLKDEQRMSLFNGSSKKPEAERSQMAKAMDEELRALSAEYDQLQEQIRRVAPRYIDLVQPPELTGDAIKQLLDDQTVLLVYSLGEQRSYLWAITPTSVDSYPLPPRHEIEDKAREVYKWMTAEQWLDKSNFEKFVQEARRAEVRYREQAAVLSQSLLGPVAAQLGRKRLLIVGEGALQRLSFAALPQPETRRADAAVRRQKGVARSLALPAHPPVFTPLIADHEIVTLPSVSVLAAMRRDFAGRQTAPKSLAMFADPIFSGDDPRLARTPGNPPQKVTESISASGELQQSLREIGVADIEKRFPRLWGTKTEAEYIIPLVSPDSRLVMMNAEASVETVKNTDLGQYRLIHFATHGLLNNENPELSGLVFSLFNARGQRQNGFLRMHEIYNLKLGADIVVLSSCEGGDGKDVRGEGLMALTRGFFYAGTPRVVASLWTADDAATPILMQEFYKQLIEKSATPAAALKAAQLAVRGRRQWQAPYYWAGFVLQGEYR